MPARKHRHLPGRRSRRCRARRLPRMGPKRETTTEGPGSRDGCLRIWPFFPFVGGEPPFPFAAALEAPLIGTKRLRRLTAAQT